MICSGLTSDTNPSMGVDGDPDRITAGRGARLDAGKAVEEYGEDQGVQGVPGVELLASDDESVRRGAQGEALATMRSWSSYSVSGSVARPSASPNAPG